MVVIPKLNSSLEHDIISGIIDAVGRSILITYNTSRVICPTCGGNDPFCPTCNGNKTVDAEATKTLTANIEWKGTDTKRYTPLGQFVDGDCMVTFAVPLEDYEQYDDLLKQALSITVDGRVCVIHRWFFEGSPINRISVVLGVDDSTDRQRIG